MFVKGRISPHHPLADGSLAAQWLVKSGTGTSLRCEHCEGQRRRHDLEQAIFRTPTKRRPSTGCFLLPLQTVAWARCGLTVANRERDKSRREHALRQYDVALRAMMRTAASAMAHSTKRVRVLPNLRRTYFEAPSRSIRAAPTKKCATSSNVSSQKGTAPAPRAVQPPTAINGPVKGHQCCDGGMSSRWYTEVGRQTPRAESVLPRTTAHATNFATPSRLKTREALGALTYCCCRKDCRR